MEKREKGRAEDEVRVEQEEEREKGREGVQGQEEERVGGRKKRDK